MEERKLARVFARETFEMLEAFELALERALVLEGVPPHDLDGTQDPGGAARKPDIAVRTTANAPKEFVVRDGRRLVGGALNVVRQRAG